jgi:type III pantothenate kinase
MKNLFLEIGNTNMNYAFTTGKKIIGKDKIPTCKYLRILQLIKKYNPDNVIIASVVPEIESQLCKILNASRQFKIVRIGRDIKVPVKNKYLKPEKVGIDRLLNAYYVKEKFSLPAICIDLGTAITIDVVSSRGEFCGGLIFPGVKLCYDVLGEKTSLLPRLKPQKSGSRLYGRSTEECIHFGIINGISNLLCGVIRDLSEQLKNKEHKTPKVILTGSDTTFFVSIIRKNKWKRINDLTLKSMMLLWPKLCEK